MIADWLNARDDDVYATLQVNLETPVDYCLDVNITKLDPRPIIQGMLQHAETDTK